MILIFGALVLLCIFVMAGLVAIVQHDWNILVLVILCLLLNFKLIKKAAQ